jgi:hypothetical protein
MSKKLSQTFALFFLCFGAGYAVIHFTTPDTGINRDPAAIGKVYDFSHLQGEDLNTAVKRRLLAGFEVLKENGDQGVTLGHFVFVDPQGEKKFACQEFNKVTLTFIADGVAVGGEAPEMQVEGACEFSSDITKINPLWIPVAKILNEKVGDGEFQYNQGKAITLRFSNMPEQWPHTWLLRSVELRKDNTAEAVTIQSEELTKYVGHPTVLKF